MFAVAARATQVVQRLAGNGRLGIALVGIDRLPGRGRGIVKSGVLRCEQGQEEAERDDSCQHTY